jgi:hypothetical protein
MPATNQFFAPEGYGELRKGVRYHCLRNDVRQGRVFLACFFTARPGSQLHVLTTAAYETALAHGMLVPCETMIYLPPWLSVLESMDLDLCDAERRKAVRRHRDMVEQRRAYLQPLMEGINEIFTADNPDLEINRYARRADRPQNETRLRLWFYVYLAFGQNLWALMAPFHLNGLWCRAEKRGQKFGRPASEGGSHGYPCGTSMADAIEASFIKYAIPGRSMIEIYAMAMEHIFDCKTVVNEDGSTSYVQASGQPFPSENQFRYWCKKRIGGEAIQRTLYGEQRFRNRLQANQGRFSQAVANLAEKIEGDAYSTLEHPRGYTAGHVSPKLYVVRLICVTSGLGLGIGFAHGSETGAAYRGALFCAAVGKRRYGALFGIVISDEEWPSEGLSPCFIPDRGAGASEDVVARLRNVVTFVELPPSHTPQSHATVEAHHPRDVNIEGEPTYRTVNLDAVGLARREIYTLLAHNRSASAIDRMTVDMRRDKVLATPLGIWRYLAARGRSDEQPMSFEDAVRTLLTPASFDLVDGRLFLKKLAYGSNELSAALAARGYGKRWPATSLSGYVLDMCVRHAWVVVGRRLIQVDAQLPIRDDERQLYMSLTELEEYERAARNDRRRVDRNRPAARSAIMTKAREDLGVDPRASRRLKGRAKAKTPVAKRELSHMKRAPKAGR